LTRRPVWLATALLMATSPALAQADVIITGSLHAQRTLETPFAITSVDSQALREAGAMVNLSEALARVPGLVVANRNNHAQDLQISSRGFGARAGFGVRGIRLFSDGIPASMPDGQGQVAHFDLAGAARIEVLRGPFSVLYGSSSGGVIALVGAPPREPRAELSIDAGAFGFRQARAAFGAPLAGGLDVKASFSATAIQGLRPQSAASRQLAHLRLGWQGIADTVLVLAGSHRQNAHDPLGLSPEQFAANPRQTTAQALDFDTRKTVHQDQAGLNWRHRFGPASVLEETQVMAYTGWRSVLQFLAIPVATQASPRHGGGVVDVARTYDGFDLRSTWRLGQAGLMLGLAQERLRDARQGFENFLTGAGGALLGVPGALRRDEINQARSRDIYVQLEWPRTAVLAVTSGVRSGQVGVTVKDRLVPFTPTNPDDSGTRQFNYTNPVLGLRWNLSPSWALHASAALGSETPTLGELAYRADNTGFNADLKAQRSRQIEVGSKWRGGVWEADATVFQVQTQDELAVRSNASGRASFQNVGATRRQGAELALRWQAAPGLRWQLAVSALDARYRDRFATCVATPCPTAANPAVAVEPGLRIAGTQATLAWTELAWRSGVIAGEVALEARGQARTAANDRNSVFAPGFVLMNLRWSHSLPLPGLGELQLLARVDNVLDQAHVGSVIVGDANGRFFEPGAPRAMQVSLRWAGRW
jgi:iron complex outermembrane recepter protein